VNRIVLNEYASTYRNASAKMLNWKPQTMTAPSAAARPCIAAPSAP